LENLTPRAGRAARDRVQWRQHRDKTGGPCSVPLATARWTVSFLTCLGCEILSGTVHRLSNLLVSRHIYHFVCRCKEPQ
jgi:hypothetical protein